jgi:hypothetical protein
MEPVVLEVNPASLGNAVAVYPDVDLMSPALMRSFTELMTTMHDVKVAAVLEDLDLYERTGHMTRLIEDVIRRAECLAEADRIMETF